MKSYRKQVNNYIITYSKLYNKFQVSKNGVKLEEFAKENSAVSFCTNN